MAIQGKCNKCKIRYCFEADHSPLKAFACPRCGEQLKATSNLSKLPVYQENPVVYKTERRKD